MVHINPSNIIRLLIITYNYSEKQLTDNESNPHELELHDAIKNIIDTAVRETSFVFETDSRLEFEDMVRPHFTEIADENEPSSSFDLENVEEQYEETCGLEDGNIDPDYKRQAVEFWRSGKQKRRNVSSVQSKFKKVRTALQLYRWEKYLQRGGTHKEKLLEIAEYVLCNFAKSMDQNAIVHDIDIRRWALEANAKVNLENFKASRHWILQFKQRNGIVSRKITKFVGRSYRQDKADLETIAKDFIASVKPYIGKCGADNVYNADESGFNLELHAGRTLTYKGGKTVECAVQSVTSTTHSYTVLPLISAAGKLVSPLLIVFKEAGGTFGPRVREHLFQVNIDIFSNFK